MPPNDIYHSPAHLQFEQSSLFPASWIYVGHTGQLKTAGDVITSNLGGKYPILVRRCTDGVLRGFVNICRHRAAQLINAKEGLDTPLCVGKRIQCPYHGWEYDSDSGQLAKCTMMKGVTDFKTKEFSLLPVYVQTLGSLVFVHGGEEREGRGSLSPSSLASTFMHDGSSNSGSGESERYTQLPLPSSCSSASVSPPSSPPPSFSSTFESLEQTLDLNHYEFVERNTYSMRCNWKVFADNYLDGGYHIQNLHPGLASQLNMGEYKSTLFANYSIQSCASPSTPTSLKNNEVVGRVSDPLYAWLFPCTAINKYSHWVDVHVVVPISERECLVTFDYFLDRNSPLHGDPVALTRELDASRAVQREDISICESVQLGLESAGYTPGRYGGPESPAFHFAQWLSAHARRRCT